MDKKIVVLGSGYSGCAAIKKLQKDLPKNCDLVWISENPYHFVLHESHRVIRDLEVVDKITFPVSEIKNSDTEFIQDKVTDIHNEKREIELDSGKSIDYDYTLVAIGSDTAYYDIPGVDENSISLKGLDDAKEIHTQIKKAGESASPSNPAKVIVGGAGLTGIQCAGEIAEYRDRKDLPIETYLVEGRDVIFSQGSSKLRERLTNALDEKSVNILTGDRIVEVDREKAIFNEGEPLEYDVLVWTGGIKGPSLLEETDLEIEQDILYTENDLQTSDERVFATGDAAFITHEEKESPPTAYVAWKSGETASENIIRDIKGKELKKWRYTPPGILVSVGDRVFASNIRFIPLDTFDSWSAKFLKRFAAARWIANITSWKKAIDSWRFL